MKYTALIILFCQFVGISFGQPYKLLKEVSTLDSIKVNDDVDNIGFKIKNDKSYQLRRIRVANDKYDLKITSFNIKSGQLLSCDTLSGLPKDFFIIDFTFNDKFMIITSFDKYILFNTYNIENSIYLYPEHLEFINESTPFKQCEILNDSMVLLYIIYNYHPNDNRPGFYMKILNVNNKQILTSKFLNFPGIGISHLSSNWVTVIKDKIYVFNPLSEEFQIFDFNLNILTESHISIFEKSELQKNIAYEKTIDSTVESECKRILAIKTSIPKDSLKYHQHEMYSPVYSKKFISNTINTVQQDYVFIQNVFPIDDSIIAIVVSKPGYEFKFRDLVLFDPNKNKILKTYKKFPCGISDDDSLSKPEDFYKINISNVKLLTPYFHRDSIYTGSIYPMALYKNGNINDVTENMYKKINKFGYIWSILEYKLN